MSTNESYYNDVLLPKITSGEHVGIVVKHHDPSTSVAYYYFDEEEPDETSVRRASVTVRPEWGEEGQVPDIEDRKTGVDWLEANDWPEPEHDNASGTRLRTTLEENSVYIVERDACPAIE
jgi:hypothetical protein